MLVPVDTAHKLENDLPWHHLCKAGNLIGSGHIAEEGAREIVRARMRGCTYGFSLA